MPGFAVCEARRSAQEKILLRAVDAIVRNSDSTAHHEYCFLRGITNLPEFLADSHLSVCVGICNRKCLADIYAAAMISLGKREALLCSELEWALRTVEKTFCVLNSQAGISLEQMAPLNAAKAYFETTIQVTFDARIASYIDALEFESLDLFKGMILNATTNPGELSRIRIFAAEAVIEYWEALKFTAAEMFYFVQTGWNLLPRELADCECLLHLQILSKIWKSFGIAERITALSQGRFLQLAKHIASESDGIEVGSCLRELENSIIYDDLVMDGDTVIYS